MTAIRLTRGLVRFKVAMAILALVGFTMTTCASAPVRVVVDCPACLWHNSLDVLHDQVGIVEATGNNDGKEVKAYLASTGLDEGYPWCQALQYWAFYVTAENMGLDKVEIPLKRTASTRRAFEQALNDGRRVTPVVPQVGDLVTWWYKGTWKGHVERIIDAPGGGWVTTIGGNTSNGKSGSQREGNGVFVRRRNWLHPLGRMLVRGFIGRDSDQ